MGVFENFPYTNFHDLNLDWILQETKKALENVNIYTGKVDTITAQVEGFEHELNIVNSEIATINSELAKVKDGYYIANYINSLSAWINSNLQELVSSTVKFIAVSLDAAGHLVFDIPNTWKFLEFDTIMDGNDVNYGKLTLKW